MDGQIDQPMILMNRTSDCVRIRIADLEFVGPSVGNEGQLDRRLAEDGDYLLHPHPWAQRQVQRRKNGSDHSNRKLLEAKGDRAQYLWIRLEAQPLGETYCLTNPIMIQVLPVDGGLRLTP